eukprot:scaffold17666_cov66-Phaeocystis_antarctica.AAC.4
MVAGSWLGGARLAVARARAAAARAARTARAARAARAEIAAVARATAAAARATAAAGWETATGLCSFPEPSSSHSQRWQRPRCPSTRNGWLACWRRTKSLRTAESKGGHAVPGEVRARRQEGIGAATALGACRGGVDCRLGAGHGEERTPNMLCMAVTLEVSKLSGWLNANACCRESKGGHTVRGEGAGREAGGGGRPRRTQRAGEGAAANGGRAWGEAHEEHGVRRCDAGRLFKIQRPVEG